MPRLLRMSGTISGVEKRLSTGMSKKPWIWPACSSIVSTREAPATVIRLATSLAEIGVRGDGLAVLPGIAEIGHHGGDAPRRGAPQRVDDDQQLHQIVVGRMRGRLDDEDVLAADVLVDLDEDLHVGEAVHGGLGEVEAQRGGNGLGQRSDAVAGEQLHRCMFRKAAGVATRGRAFYQRASGP